MAKAQEKSRIQWSMDAAEGAKSGLFDELLFAAGAGDANGALAFGNLNLHFAAGALEIAIVFPAFDAGEELGEFLIFRIPLGDVAGKGAVEGQRQRDVCQHLKDRKPGEGADEIQHNTQNKQKQPQLIHAVSSGHKSNHGGSQTL